jgi:RNA 2',3'-cyclic 3'-phosphodiesterase
MKRTFAAIKVVPDENLIKVYRELKSTLNDNTINWVADKNIHITLKFFGDTTDHQIDAICSLFDEIAGNHRPFSFTLKGTGIFGSRYDPRVIWLGIENGRALENLAVDVLNGVEEIGFQRDRQNFRPHLTIGRIKKIADKRGFQRVIDRYSDSFIQEVHVEEFYLIESRLRPQGPVYEIIETFRL